MLAALVTAHSLAFGRHGAVSAGIQVVWFILTASLTYGVWRRSRASWVGLLVLVAWPLLTALTLSPTLRSAWIDFAPPVMVAALQVALLLTPQLRRRAWGSRATSTVSSAPP